MRLRCFARSGRRARRRSTETSHCEGDPMFRRLLIANRGEIAIRVARTAREMGIRSVGVYSEADRSALHRNAMDETLMIGGALPADSYLNIERILEAARVARVEAIHPGYGFLSENPTFATRCGEAGLVFVGPPPDAMALSGDKIAARKSMAGQGVPVTRGVDRPLRSVDEASTIASEIGYPVLFKATAGVRGLRAIGYRNAGTVEFLLHDGSFTFNEVNARLQVEHPITEMVTGVDLVRQQIRIAAGDGLEISQAELTRHGHAIECRVNAEDPIRNFLPSPGRVVGYHEPTGSGVRIDSGVATGSVVPPYYDPLIAKLIVHARNRGQAIERMRRSIEGYEIRGVLTNLPFHRELLQRREFVRGDLWTTMVADLRIAARLRSRGPWEERVAAIAAALVASGQLARGATYPLERPSVARWALAGRRERLSGGGPAVSPRRRW